MFSYFLAWSVQFLSIALGLMIGAAPAIASVFMLTRSQLKKIAGTTYRQLLAALASITVALAIFAISFFETKIYSSQSLANVMYLFAIAAAFLAWIAGYFLGFIVDKRFSKLKQVASWMKYVPVSLIVIFACGVIKHVAPSVDVELVRNSESNSALTYLALRESTDGGKNDGIAARIAYSGNTPSSALAHLSRHHNNTIRLWVASNKNTSIGTLIALKGDCNERVRFQVFKRLSTTSTTTPSANCSDDNAPVTDTPYR